MLKYRQLLVNAFLPFEPTNEMILRTAKINCIPSYIQSITRAPVERIPSRMRSSVVETPAL